MKFIILFFVLLSVTTNLYADCQYSSGKKVDRSTQRAEYKKKWIQSRLDELIDESTLYYEGKEIEKKIEREYYALGIDKLAPKDQYFMKNYAEGTILGQYICLDEKWERR
jgi:hypothetical protein